MIKHLGKWAHTKKNPLEMSRPLELSTLIISRQRVRGCFISFYAELPAFTPRFSDFYRGKMATKEPSTGTL